MYYLLFRAIRTRPRPFWAFWEQRTDADVYAFVPVTSEKEAQERATAEMEARGWRIDHYKYKRPVDETFRQDSLDVRLRIRRAAKGESVYTVYPAFEYATKESTMDSRYLANPDVQLDPARVPEPLRPLLRFADRWAITDDEERSGIIARASKADKKELVDAVTPLFDDIASFANAHENSVPVPDEVVVLNLIAEAADTASHDVAG